MSKKAEKDAHMAGLYIEHERARCVRILIELKWEYDQLWTVQDLNNTTTQDHAFVASATLRRAIDAIRTDDGHKSS